eukprot:m.18415 g.18415  ORF g.18415 m.18415 type:complete len:65 (+) comp7823_c0_seq1:158-352(+)
MFQHAKAPTIIDACQCLNKVVISFQEFSPFQADQKATPRYIRATIPSFKNSSTQRLTRCIPCHG